MWFPPVGVHIAKERLYLCYRQCTSRERPWQVCNDTQARLRLSHGRREENQLDVSLDYIIRSIYILLLCVCVCGITDAVIWHYRARLSLFDLFMRFPLYYTETPKVFKSFSNRC